VLAPSRTAEPVLLHWGRDLGDLTDEDLAALAELQRPGVPQSALDEPRQLGLLPDSSSGFTGTPALEGRRAAAGPWAPRLREWSWTRPDGPDHRVRLEAQDTEAGWGVALDLELTREGVLRLRTQVTNTGTDALTLGAVRTALPVAAEAAELLDLTGRWCHERTPQRQPWQQGTHLRQGRHGRTGHDATLLLLAGTPGFGFRGGAVWGVHTAWSGDHVTYAERTPEGESLLGGGELLGPGEVVLAAGSTYTSPWLVGAWSAAGMDGVSARLHAWVRRHADRSRRPRPVLLNTWEATYFDHDLDRLRTIADTAASVGVERFVLDDGWFAGRRHDRAGLGDWTVDAGVWPDGLHPLVDHVRGLGMEFGLWVEPEMVNVGSDLAREHPAWVLRGRADLPPEWRHQQVLDLQRPDAYAHVRDALLALLEEYDIAYLKWDHNRDLVDVSHGGRPAVHGQTTAFYRMLDELRSAHPALEIESCASGGGRVDLGVLSRTDRVWASDTIDALERQHIQRWTTLLVPPELVGSHLGGPTAHTTGRTHRLGFRAATALLGHFGIEWDLTGLSPDDLASVGAWVELYKRVRDVLGDGTLVRVDHPDPAVVATGVVAADRSEAYFVVATVATTATQTPPPVLLSGLDPDRRYLVRSVAPPGDQHVLDLGQGWLAGPGVLLPGSALADVGVRLPVTAPESAYVLHVGAEAEGNGA
jgi:alpha-galactosidase